MHALAQFLDLAKIAAQRVVVTGIQRRTAGIEVGHHG